MYKRSVDIALAGLLLAVSLPFLAIAAIIIKLDSAGPVIFRQVRTGRHFRSFELLKLRTMRDTCGGTPYTLGADQRITRSGRWLRCFKLDELPQLWNVLCGDMSLIGPRPERPEFMPQLEQAIPLYRYRLHARPGITGFAQIQLPPDSDLDSVRVKLAYDLHYVRNMSFRFDVAIYLGTLFKLIGLTYEAIRPLCRFTPRAAVESEYQNLSAPAEKM